jgi:hypothetical protein
MHAPRPSLRWQTQISSSLKLKTVDCTTNTVLTQVFTRALRVTYAVYPGVHQFIRSRNALRAPGGVHQSSPALIITTLWEWFCDTRGRNEYQAGDTSLDVTTTLKATEKRRVKIGNAMIGLALH